MTTQHTPEPWRVAEESFDNGGIQESVIRGLDGRAAIAVTLEFGPNNPGMREANARRIVACVNACAGIRTEALEHRTHMLKAEDDSIATNQQQRDELLAALEGLTGWFNSETKDSAYKYLDKAEQAIAKAKGGAA